MVHLTCNNNYNTSKGRESMKKIISIACLVFSFGLFLFINTPNVDAASKKVAVLFHDSSERYANAVHPEGTYNGKKVFEKVDYSSAFNKELKAYHMYKQQGFDVTKIYEKDLNNLDTMSQYDAIVFVHTVLMNHKQRENVKMYVRNGGGAIFAFQTGRNEGDLFPQPGKPDISPLIFHVDSWVMEWDNLTEVFGSRFIDDVVLRDSTVSNKNTTHPIIKNAAAELGQSTFKMFKSNDEWVEIIKPWKGGSATPLLHFTDYTNTDKPNLMKKGEFGAAHAVEYGKGRVVQIGFKIMDYINVTADANWEDGGNGAAFGGTKGDKEAAAFMKHSLKWVSENHNKNVPRRYKVDISTSDVSSYLAPSKQFVYRSTVHVKNNGNVPARGTIKVEILNANGVVVGKGHERYHPGLAADATTDNADNRDISTHSEKYEIFMPGNLAPGTYTVRASFVEGRKDRKNIGETFTTAAEIKTLTRARGSNKATIGTAPFFPDVSKSGGGYYDIKDLHAIGIVKGDKGRFNPNGNLTRIQATEMVLRALGVTSSASATLNASDLKKGDYGYEVLATGARYGIISLENGKINAHQPIKRADMARALVNGFKLQGTTKNSFKDVPSNNPYYKDIQALYALNITTGYEDNTFRPNGTLTRKNFAQFVNRTIHANTK